MSSVYRGAKNAFRSAVRTFAVVLILALCVGLALAMAMARQAVDERVQSVQGTLGNAISVTPAGARNFFGGGEPLTESNLSKLDGIDHISRVERTLVVELQGNQTSLKSGVQAGTLGGRQGSGPDGGGRGGGFRQPLLAVGQSSLETINAFGNTLFTLVNGTLPNVDGDDGTAAVGSLLSRANGLHPGSVFTVRGANLTVSGVFNSTTNFANNVVVMSLATAQRVANLPGEVSSAIIRVDSIENVPLVTEQARAALGSAADLTPEDATAEQAVAPLKSVSKVAVVSLIIALAAGSIIMFLTMVMIVRERRREIGVLKALGAANWRIVTQFFAESAVLVSIGAVIGTIFGALVSDQVVSVLVASERSSPGGGGPGVGGRGGGFAAFGTQGLIQNVHTTFNVDVLGWAVLAIVLIALVGSALPSYFIAKVRPAEVLRGE